jgi:[acyl-carrier-protein] S-malonyltransferase
MVVASSADSVPGNVVATVAGRHISMARLEERAALVRRGPRGRHLPAGPVAEWGPEWQALRGWLVQELVTEEVLVHEARLAGVADGVDLVRQVTLSVTVAEDEVRAYYDRNPDLYLRPESRRVRHLVRAEEAAARLGAVRIDAAEELELRRGELAGPVEDAIFAAAIGTTVGPIRTEHGWHVARVEGATPPSVVPYAEARSAIEAELLTAARSRAFDAWLESRRKALAVVEPEFAHPGDPVHGMPSHRH